MRKSRFAEYATTSWSPTSIPPTTFPVHFGREILGWNTFHRPAGLMHTTGILGDRSRPRFCT